MNHQRSSVAGRTSTVGPAPSSHPAANDRRRQAAALIWLALLAVGCASHDKPSPAADASSQRQTASGPVVGFQGQYGSHVWLGIPYAKPPVGDLRWRAPQPPPAWTDTRVALAVGSPCTQYASKVGGAPGPSGTVAGSEDCLYLNIYAPRVGPDAVPAGAQRWPVMVWIHGGGNTIGEAGFYDGGNLAATEQVIVVSLNYRLGPLGWFRHAALRADTADAADQSGNFAILDLVRALEWVRDNIAAFGGDPQNVTIFGESAGGRNVFSLLLAPPAKGLFHRAIVQSGGAWMNSPSEAEEFSDAAEAGDQNSSNEVLSRLLVRDGKAADRAAAKAQIAAMSSADIAAYLRGKSAADFTAAYTPGVDNGMFDMPQVFSDGAVLPDEPLQHLARADGYNRVPVMLGTNLDESKLFMMNDPQWVKRYLWIVPRLRDERMYNLTSEYQAAMWKATGADMPAAAISGTQPNTYVYRFDWNEEPTLLGADFGVMLGAAHLFEVPFVFGHFDLGSEGNRLFTEENAPGRRALARKMMGYWAQFARSGAPGRGGDGSLTEWSAWGAGPNGGQFLVLDTDAGGGTRMSSETKTVESVLAAVDADPRLSAARDRCAILQALAQRSRGFTEKEYAARGTCGDFPFDKYPWS
jgi:para-nitrobenzyl esterase